MTTTTFGSNTGNTGSSSSTRIREAVPDNTGFSHLEISINNGVEIHSLLKFDISSIASDRVVTAVTIRLYKTSTTGATTVSAYRLLRNWVKAQATWNSWATASAWTTPGATGSGDSSATLSVSLAVGNPAGYYDFVGGAQLIADVQGFVDGSFANYGHVFTALDTFSTTRYESEDGTTGQRPEMVVTHESAAGGDPVITWIGL